MMKKIIKASKGANGTKVPPVELDGISSEGGALDRIFNNMYLGHREERSDLRLSSVTLLCWRLLRSSQ